MTTAAENVEIANGFFGALGVGEMEKAASFVADDIRWTYHGDENQIPFAGTFIGMTGIGEFFGKFMAVADPLEMAPVASWGAEGQAFVRGIEKSKAKSTGKEYAVEWIHVYKIQNGKILSFDEYLDTSKVAAALAGA